jgi:hypothetical protein
VPIKRKSEIKRKSDLFRRRIVIAVPDWSVFVVAGAVGFGLLDKPLLVTNIICLVTTVVALVTVWLARRQLRALRYEVHEALNNINTADDELIQEVSEPPAEPITLKKIDNRVNGKRSTRVSE